MKVTTDSCLFGAWVSSRAPLSRRMLDIGAGTGLLSLMLAQQHDTLIDAVEIGETCSEELKENVRLSPWPGRIRAIHADVRNMELSRAYGLIISNPPFHNRQLRSPDLSTNVARHDTELRLEDLLATVNGMLEQDGLFAILMPYYRKLELLDLGASFNMYPTEIMDVRHSPAHPWQRTMMLLSRVQVSAVTGHMDIRDEKGTYSALFSALLAPYYLTL